MNEFTDGRRRGRSRLSPVDRVPRQLLAKTLAGRLATGGVAWIALWALGLLLIFNLLLSSVLSDQVDSSLQARAEAVSATIRAHDAGLTARPGNDEALDAGTSIYFGREVFEGAALSPELEAQLLQRGDQKADREALGPVRYLAQPIRLGGRQVGTIVVSSDIGSLDRSEKIVAAGSVAFILTMLLFTFFALRGTITRAMRPVRDMGDSASAWSDKDIGRRFDPDAGPLELRELAITLNALLERISATLRRERSFVAEMSHELRTPLAHLHAELDLLATDVALATPVNPADLARLLSSVQRLEGLVEGGIAPARLELPGATGLAWVADVLADLPGPPDAARRPLVRGDVSLRLAVEEDLVRRALVPVLENAWRYARNQVRIDVSSHDGIGSIAITDDGGQLDPANAEHIFEPGFRGRADDGHPGAGLGLALTRRICRAAGGDAVATSGNGYSVLTLTFPCIATQ